MFRALQRPSRESFSISSHFYESIVDSLKPSQRSASGSQRVKPRAISHSDQPSPSTTYDYHFSDGTTFQVSRDISTMIRALNRVEAPFTGHQDSDRMVSFYLGFLSKLNRMNVLQSQIHKNLNQRDPSWIHVVTDFGIWRTIWDDLWDGASVQEDLWALLR